MIATIKAPNASDPVWYAKIHLIAMQRDAFPLSSEAPPYEKYHIAQVAAMRN